MDIIRLRYFAAVAETGSMRQAAELLRLTPSALSRGVAQLEDDLGKPLFARVGRGLQLNDDGKRLYALSRQLLDDYERLRQDMRQGTSSPRPLCLGSFEVFTTYFFGELVRTLFPDQPIRLLELTPGAIEEALLSRRIDLGLTYAPAPHPDVEFLRAGSFSMGVFARKGAFKGVATQELPFVVPVTGLAGSIVGFRSLDGWPDDRFPRQAPFHCELLETALELARQGVAALHCPAFIVRLHNSRVRDEMQLAPRQLPKGMQPVVMTAHIVKRRVDPEDSTVKRLAKGLRTILVS